MNGSPQTSAQVGAVRITELGTATRLYFPALRAAGSALMLALFGAACCVIGIAAIVGLLSSGGAMAANLLAFSFAGVFALPLVGLGIWFLAVAIWTAANSLSVEVTPSGLHTERRCFGLLVGRQAMPCGDIAALDAQPAAKYVGAFGATPYFRLFARDANRALLIADSLKGEAMAGQVQDLIIDRLRKPGLAKFRDAKTGDSRSS